MRPRNTPLLTLAAAMIALTMSAGTALADDRDRKAQFTSQITSEERAPKAQGERRRARKSPFLLTLFGGLGTVVTPAERSAMPAAK